MGIAMCNFCGVEVKLGRSFFRKNLGVGEWAPLSRPYSQCYPLPPFGWVVLSVSDAMRWLCWLCLSVLRAAVHRCAGSAAVLLQLIVILVYCAGSSCLFP